MTTRLHPPPLPGKSHIPWAVKLLVGLGILFGVVLGLFHPVENWRGKRAWEGCKRGLKAKGESLDWDSFVPPAIPEERNVVRASAMEEWFIRKGTNQLIGRLAPERLLDSCRFRYSNVLADIAVVSPQNSVMPASPDLVLSYAPPMLKAGSDVPPGAVDPESEIVPLVVIDEVPLREAVKHLARQAKLNYALDPKLNSWSEACPEPVIHGRWEDVSAKQVLLTILNQHKLQWVDDPHKKIGLITQNQSSRPMVYMDIVLRERIKGLLLRSIGANTNDLGQESPRCSQGAMIVLQAPCAASPARFVLFARKAPEAAEVAAFFPTNAFLPDGMAVEFRVESYSQGFRLMLGPPPYIATDYLAWSDQFEPEFNLIRQALQRPCVRLEADFKRPFDLPCPNYLAVRSLTETLCKRAESFLLLGQPGQALRELTLINDFRRVLQNKPMTVVSAMIDAGVVAMYTSTVAEGLRLRRWQEAQLVVLQDQLKSVSLPGMVADGLRAERAALLYTLGPVAPRTAPWELWRIPVFPRGWFYQNLTTMAMIQQDGIEIVDQPNEIVRPAKAKLFKQGIDRIGARFRPTTYIAGMAIPDFTKAFQKAALEQTHANQASVACALERYRLATGQFPENLDTLVPRFAKTIPRDILDAKPLRYRRTSDGSFSLSAAAWNKSGEATTTDREWVWPPRSQ